MKAKLSKLITLIIACMMCVGLVAFGYMIGTNQLTFSPFAVFISLILAVVAWALMRWEAYWRVVENVKNTYDALWSYAAPLGVGMLVYILIS